MSRSKTFSSQYGYVLHPKAIDHICFWCGDTCGFTWDYTPHRHIGRDKATVDHLQVPLFAVPACPRCIAKTTYRKGQLLTIEDKQAYFEAEKEKQSQSVPLLDHLKKGPRVPIWQRRLETGDIIDVPDDELNLFERKAKEAWLRQVAQPTEPEIPAYVSDLAPRTEDREDLAPKDAPSAPEATPGDVHGTPYFEF